MARSSFITTSPGAQSPVERLMMLSSSPLPDITEFATKKPKATALRSGSAAVPIPASASKTFTSAADLLRSAQACADDSADFIDEPKWPAPKEGVAKRARKTTKAPKRVAKEVIVLSSDGATPNGNNDGTNTRPEGNIRDGVEGSPLESKPWKRYKAPVDLGNTDVSAEAVELQAKPKTQRKKKGDGETASKQFSNNGGATKPKPRASTPEPINLEQAVQRRMDWTPREDNRPEIVPTPLVPSNTEPPPTSPAPISSLHDPLREDIFKNLHDTYAHKVTDQKECAPTNPEPITLGKRKIIELTSLGQSAKQKSHEVSPMKQKAPKKKPRTITELATAAYAPKPVEPPEDPFQEDSILEYFDVDKKGSVSKTTAGKGKGKTTKVTKKKAPPKQPVLLSPKAALRQSARQDFVFGTSSQLVREESPTFLRDLQAALRASNIIASENVQSLEGLSRANDLTLESTKRGGGLWSVSARDEDGEMVDIEVINFESSHFPEDDAVAILDPWKDVPPELPDASGTEAETAEPSLIEIESMPVAMSNTSSQPPVPKSHFFLTQPKVTIKAAAAATAGSSNLSSTKPYPRITDLTEEGDAPPPSNQEQSSEDIKQISPKMPRKIQKTRPNYELFTDAKLAKEVSSFGFKAVKSRSGMLALLNQCWESRSRTPITAAASFSTSARSPSPKGKKKAPAADPVATSPAPKRPRARTKKADKTTSDPAAATGGDSIASPPKKRGRPRKDASAAAGPSTTTAQPAVSTPKRRKATTQPRTEIIDSDLDSDDSSGLSPEKIFTSPGGGAVDMSINEDTEITLDLSPTAQQSVLFSHITRAITSAPRTTDPENPSWHEKMLMYDPVILEDLAAWLNEGQLTRVGYDGEASPMDVKKWCESKSVCCLWRGTWRGKERKRL